jgi:hypothetical protein
MVGKPVEVNGHRDRVRSADARGWSGAAAGHVARARRSGEAALEPDLEPRQRPSSVQLGTERRAVGTDAICPERAAGDPVRGERGLESHRPSHRAFVSQPPLGDVGLAAFGMGDITTSFFFSPSQSKWLVRGAGPGRRASSTSEPTLGTRKWSAGPTAIVLKQTGPWTFGALWNQVWSFSGDSNGSDMSQMFLQPFLAYQATRTITLTLQSESTANWEADANPDRWTIPVNVSVSKLASFGTFPASYQVGFGGFPAHPDVGPSWKVRGVIVILIHAHETEIWNPRPSRKALGWVQRRQPGLSIRHRVEHADILTTFGGRVRLVHPAHTKRAWICGNKGYRSHGRLARFSCAIGGKLPDFLA